MIFIFGSPENALSVHLYSKFKANNEIKPVRNKAPGISFEILTDKKSGLKVVGFSNVVNFLAQNQPNNSTHDFYCWLTTSFNLSNTLHQRIAGSRIGESSIYDFYLYSKLFFSLKNGATIPENLQEFYSSQDKALAAEVQKFISINFEEPKAQATKKDEISKTQNNKESGKNQQKTTATDKKPVAEKKVQAPKKKEEVPQEYLDLVNSQRIVRLNQDIILPVEGKRNILVTSALPYVNNVPHLGNLIGAVLSADVFSRYSRLRGYNTIYICGTDEYGTATQTKAILEGKTPQEICDFYHKIHAKIYEDFQIDFNHFGRTSTEKHSEIVQMLFKQVKDQGYFQKQTIKQFYCEVDKMALADRFIVGTCPHCGYEEAKGDQCDKCGKLLNPEDLIKPRCSICSTAPIIIDSDHYFLNLKTLTGKIENFIDTASVKGSWTENSISISKSWLERGLEPRCMTRDLDWGVKVPEEGFEKKVFYVWFDAPIGYPSITANYTSDWQKWWCNPENVDLYQFMGKDNVPFHTVLFPATLLGTNNPWTLIHHISTTEYLNYESGKFSKSSNRGIFGDHVAQMPYPVCSWRYYLLSNRPEQADSVFNWDDFKSKINEELLPKPANLVQRVLKYIYSKMDKQIPVASFDELKEGDLQFLEKVKLQIKKYCDSFEITKMRKALKIVMEISADCNKFMQDEQVWDSNVDENRRRIVLALMANCIRIVSCLFEPFMPDFSAKVYFFLGLTRSLADETLLETLLTVDSKEYINLIPHGLTMNLPVPIVQKIEDVTEFRKKFQ